MQQARKVAFGNQVVSPAQPTRDPSIAPQPDRRFKKVKTLLILTTCFLLSLVVVAQYSSLVILNYQLSSARHELSSTVESSRKVELEVAQLSSINRIEEIAKDELGMVEPDPGQVNVITASQRISERSGE